MVGISGGSAIPQILSGTQTGSATILAATDALPNASIFISTNGAGEIWIMQSHIWTQLTIN